MSRRLIAFKRAEPTITNKTPAERMYSCAERRGNHRVRIQNGGVQITACAFKMAGFKSPRAHSKWRGSNHRVRIQFEGPPLSFFERLSRNMSLAGALAQGDTSGKTKDPNGHRNGIPGGTNVGGWSFPPLQAGVSLFQIISAVGLKPKDLVDKIAAATKRGQRVIISEGDNSALKMVDELIPEAGGRAELAQRFQQVGSVMPFSMGQKVTAGLESKFQAHKIFEKQAFEHFETIFGPNKKALDEAIAKAPSVVLTDAENAAGGRRQIYFATSGLPPIERTCSGLRGSWPISSCRSFTLP